MRRFKRHAYFNDCKKDINVQPLDLTLERKKLSHYLYSTASNDLVNMLELIEKLN